MSKLSAAHQGKWSASTLYSRDVLAGISSSVQLHNEFENILSSAGACLNVLGNLARDPEALKTYLNVFGLGIEELIPFPTGTVVGGEVYDDKGYVVFEWIGPRKSPLNERGGKRGQNRTSIDAYIIAVIEHKVTQLLVEWKFTENYSAAAQYQKFAGVKGNERVRRYSNVLADLRRTGTFPFAMSEEGGWGLCDLGYEPLYQLLRMTLLARTTTPLALSPSLVATDYRLLHLTHSRNTHLNIVTDAQLSCSPGLRHLAGLTLHHLWRGLLSPEDALRFVGADWDSALHTIPDQRLKSYLVDRYG